MSRLRAAQFPEVGPGVPPTDRVATLVSELCDSLKVLQAGLSAA